MRTGMTDGNKWRDTPQWFTGICAFTPILQIHLAIMAWPNKNRDMLYRRVGNSGLHVSAIGLGGWLTWVQFSTIFLIIKFKLIISCYLAVDSEATLKMVRVFAVHRTRTDADNGRMQRSHSTAWSKPMIAVSISSTQRKGVWTSIYCNVTTAYKLSYAGGQSEIIMGQAIKKFGWKRSDLVITTKVSNLQLSVL